MQKANFWRETFYTIHACSHILFLSFIVYACVSVIDRFLSSYWSQDTFRWWSIYIAGMIAYWVMGYVINFKCMRKKNSDFAVKMSLARFIQYNLSIYLLPLTSLIPFICTCLFYEGFNEIIKKQISADGTILLSHNIHESILAALFSFTLSVAIFLSICFFVYVNTRFGFIPQLFLAGAKNPIAKCFVLTRGQWWRLFLNGMPVAILAIAICIAEAWLVIMPVKFKTYSLPLIGITEAAYSLFTLLSITFNMSAFLVLYREKKSTDPTFNLMSTSEA